jgi:uncharacterized protein YgbK (DUF1537 family)
MRTVQTIGVPANAGPVEADALVVALKSRTIDTREAVEQALAALAWLRAQGCRQFYFKYCSTFDSTDAGNIGPVTEALLDALDSAFTVACPAFPENARTVYRGHLFVGDALLSESGMEHHPLTPMTDANLVRVLQRQTRLAVGLLGHDAVAKGADAIRQEITRLGEKGMHIAIADAISDVDLRALGAACVDLRLVTGGSGLALGLPANFRHAGLLSGESRQAGDLARVPGGAAVLAGSASRATNAQVAAWRESRPAFRVDPLALARGEAVVEEALAFVLAHQSGPAVQPVLVYATAASEEVKAVQRELGVAEAGHLVERALAAIACGLREQGVRKFVVAGGETSGAVVQALGVEMLRIGGQIDPGVPITATTGEVPLVLVLKSGNFGTVDFFQKALRHIEGDVQ